MRKMHVSIDIFSTTVTVLLANSFDLNMGRRPMSESDEFVKRTVTVVV